VDTIAFVAPVITEEPSLLDPAPEHLTMNDTEVNWTRIKSSTKRGRDYLTTSIGSAYTVSKKRTLATYWQCSVRNSTITCNWTFTSTSPATPFYSRLPKRLNSGANSLYFHPKFNKLQQIFTKSRSELIARDISAKELLKLCAHMNGPSV